MTDFSKTLFYCSCLSVIMNNGKGEKKLPSIRMAHEKAKLIQQQIEYDLAIAKSSRSQEVKRRKIEQTKERISELELLRDEDFIPDPCKSYLAGFYGYLKYNKWTIPTGESFPHVEKGNLVEQSAIELLSTLDGQAYSKNEQRFTNVYLSGIPDVIAGDYIIDVKSSFDAGSFFKNLYNGLPDRYWWQMQGYFYLTGIQKGEISFCLLPTPEKILEKIVAAILSKGTYYSEAEIRNNFNYNDIPAEDRRIKFIVERDDEAISKIPERIGNCRKFLISLEEQRHTPMLAKHDPSAQTDTVSLGPDGE